MFDEFHIGGAESKRKIRWQRSSDAKTASFVHNSTDADPFGQFYCWNVSRTGKRTAQRNVTFKFFVVVAGRIRLVAANRSERRIENRVEWREAFFQCVGININLERTADLAHGLRGAIEFRVFKT